MPSLFKPILSVHWAGAFSVGLMMGMLLPLLFGYAIVRHQVIPVSLIIRRSVQYLLAKNALRLLLALPLVGLALTIYTNRDRTLTDLLFHNSVWFYASLLAAVALGLAFRYNLRDWLDRRFFREAYRQDKILRELTEEVRQLDSLTEMARRVSQKVDAAIHPEGLYLFYREEGQHDLALGYSSDGSSRDLRIPAEFELLRFMEYQGDALDFPFPARTKLPPQEKEWLANLGASLIVPMRGTDDRLTGLLVLGPKKSEIPYTGSDRQLLETLANQIALVYENARLKERVAKDRRVQHEVLTRITEQQINLLKECPQCGDCYDSSARVCHKDQAELELTLPVERTLEGKYRLERLMGRGGMGAVYEATDLRLGRRVAVKVMTGRLFGDQAALRRFEREARASARLNHPNIIVVHDYGRAGAEGAYLVMELVAGTTLREALKASGPQLPAEAATYFDQILAGLKAAHDAGVIHRDLKPENVLIAKQGDGRAIIKLLDFGLAKLRSLDAADSSSPTIPGGLTTPGMVMGTFGYMSPEQLQGEEVDEGADIFAFGVMVVEALTGRRPFEGKSHAELLTSVLHQTFTLPGDAPAVRRLDAVLQKCLAKERTSRYATVIELQGELIPALKSCPEFSSLAQPRGEPDIALLSSNLVTEVKNPPDNRANSTAPLRLIAVLPFKPLSAVSCDETLEMGMADTLITRLSSLRQIIVRPLSAVYKYTGLEQDPLAAGREQRVDAVLDGSIQRTSEQIRITARLLSVADGAQLWTGQFDEKFTNIFQVQDAICEKLVSALALKLSGKEEQLLAKRYTDSPEAYQFYLKGRYEMYRFREDSWRRAVAYFKEAINEDPLYALAHVGLSYCHLIASGMSLPPKEAMVKAEAWARKALEIDERLAEAHTVLATITFLYHWDWAKAERELKRVIELKPKYAEAHWGYGVYLAIMGRFDEALLELKQAQAFDPLSLPINTDVGWVYYMSRQYTEAIEQLQQALELDPNYPEALVYLGQTYLATNEFSQAIAILDKASKVDDTPWVRAILGYALAVSGHSNEARQTIEQLGEMSQQRYVSPLHIALIFIGLDEKERAFSWLEKAYKERSDLLVNFQVDPVYDPLRSDPQFRNLLQRIGLT